MKSISSTTTLILATMLINTGLVSSAIAGASADTILTNATIYGHHNADSIAVQNGRIVYVGPVSKINGYRSANTKVLDLEGAMILPGFIDNHNHVFEAASEAGGNCELSMSASLLEHIPALEACHRQSKGDGWVMGYGFSLDAVLDSSSSLTPLQVIDRIFPDRPVILMEQTSHSMWVNSVALQLAGINKASPAPQGGAILKDEVTGELNGILFDNAGDIVMELAWNSLDDQFNQSYDGLIMGLNEAAAHGITTIGDGRLYWKRGWYEVWQQALKDNALTARISLRPWIYPADPMNKQLAFLKSVYSNNPSRLLIVNQVKMYSDGIFINGTAKTLTPYQDTYLPDFPYGINYIPPTQMKSWLTALDKMGFSAHIHAIGDGAVHESLNAIESVRKAGSDKPYTLTHVELVNKSDIPRFKELNVTADFQVGSEYIVQHEHQWAEPFLGQSRANAMMNPRAILDTGANLTLSSDWNVHDINPLVGISNSLRMGKTGFHSIEQAVDAYTINAAHSLGISDVTGSLSVGKFADFVVLNKDITKIPVSEISNTTILMTWLNGVMVYNYGMQQR
ncbi:amidohydrolase [Vibrio sp. 10N.261.51.F12]|uniref:amidohydrolase n=1 Tax=Vibrio sp. 10N.261.51.F12 TaxID=3229679 RepID=UPI003556CD05